MTKFARILDVLDLFSESVTLLTAEDIANQLKISRPTAFRYVRELTGAGFLANYSGRYSLGARIITLDYRIRSADPVLNAAWPVMRELCAETACTSILCRMYNDEIINVHHEAGYAGEALAFAGRGRPLPLFRGSASKTMLAFAPTARLKKIYERHHDDPDVRSIGHDWPAFQAYFAAIRKTGHYVSNQEVDKGTVGVSAPIKIPRVGAVASLSLLLSVDRLPLLNMNGLASILKTRNREIADKLHLLSEAAPIH
ncbi:MAG: helix-turn-helix domain-containing protein [Ottowia sp.]|uniref:IclR family transcriptional regulator n=1 Tax=Ottowia sp. TaxID=1898956 RepID=UPI003C770F8B